MRTYSNGTKAKKTKTNFFKKNMYAIILGAALLVVAAVITLTLTLGNKKVVLPPDTGTVNPPAKITFVNPLKNCVLKADASLDKLVWNSTLKQWRTHNGVDFEAVVGDEVLSIADGKVTKVEDTLIDGIVVTVTHAEGYVSVYKGLDAASVKIDDELKAGTKLGTVGNMMCEQNAGAHLHVEMQQNNSYLSVASYLNLNEDK